MSFIFFLNLGLADFDVEKFAIFFQIIRYQTYLFSKTVLKHDERNQRILSLNETERSVLESRLMMYSMTEYPFFIASVFKRNLIGLPA